MENWQESLERFLSEGGEDARTEVRRFLASHSPFSAAPVDCVQWVAVDRVRANNYNPNRVAAKEMSLLRLSVLEDGFTQPVVTVSDGDAFVVVDGFHRYLLARDDPAVREVYGGMIPVVVLARTGLEARMASTVRHNRARGNHGIEGMSALVLNMLEEGMADEDVCNQLGMEPEELLRLKHITGFAKLLKDHEYSREWKTRSQVLLKLKWEKEHGEGTAVV